MGISKIKKRDGRLDTYKPTKIVVAVEKATSAIGLEDEDLPKDIAQQVDEELRARYDGQTITVEQIQDVIEEKLMETHTDLARAYIIYRQKRSELRKLKHSILGKLDDSKLNINGLLIAKSRYLKKDSKGNITETPNDMFRRVAKNIAKAEKNPEIYEEEFFEIMSDLSFIPGGRILANAGTRENMLYSSFVIPVKDSMKGIFRALYHKALVQRLGGGTGFSFSRLRPKGRALSAATGYASGPIAFIKLFDHASDLTVHVGNRKAANMGSLSVDHPDIIEFITMKERREIRNFNISVEITDEFMEAVKNNTTYGIKDPVTGEVTDEMDANNIFHLIVTMAWKTGDPGVLFIDKINEENPLPDLYPIETTDPCGDQLLFPYDAGNVGAINLSKFVRYGRIQWKSMSRVIELAVRFLDNVVDVSSFPIKKIENMAKDNRRIGLGVMGFADMLYKLGIPYNSEKALEIADKVMKHINKTAFEASRELSQEKGPFPLFDKSIYEEPMRNCSLLAISPTGSRSIFADVSAGIEPNFALGYTRKVLGSTDITQINPVLEQELKDAGLFSQEIKEKIIQQGSLQGIDIPQDIKDIFVTAYDITPEWHIRMQSAFQKHIDNAISKTINFPKKATIEDIKNSFIMAYDHGCKGITVYREGSLSDEIISMGTR